MKFVLKITMDNAAFEGEGQGRELARILRLAAENIAPMSDMNAGETLYSATDINGNNVGEARITK